MSIRCMIVDDEPLAIELLETHISIMDELSLVASCKNAIEAIAYLRHNKVDLIFLDVQMPQLSGIDFIKTLKNKPKVIITSAYQEYAYEAYQIDAQDYLLKPITFERFLKSVNKVLDANLFEAGVNTGNRHSKGDAVYLRINRKMMKVHLDEILFIESRKDLIRLKMQGQDQKLIAQQSISAVEDKLPGDRFLRVHRSFIVAIEKITSFSRFFIEIDGAEIPIGRSYKELVMKRLNA